MFRSRIPVLQTVQTRPPESTAPPASSASAAAPHRSASVPQPEPARSTGEPTARPGRSTSPVANRVGAAALLRRTPTIFSFRIFRMPVARSPTYERTHGTRYARRRIFLPRYNTEEDICACAFPKRLNNTGRTTGASIISFRCDVMKSVARGLRSDVQCGWTWSVLSYGNASSGQ